MEMIREIIVTAGDESGHPVVFVFEIDFNKRKTRCVNAVEFPRQVESNPLVQFCGHQQYQQHIWVTAFSHICILDKNLNLIATIESDYFNDVHDLSIDDDGRLYVCNTGYSNIVFLGYCHDLLKESNRILVLDLERLEVVAGNDFSGVVKPRGLREAFASRAKDEKYRHLNGLCFKDGTLFINDLDLGVETYKRGGAPKILGSNEELRTHDICLDAEHMYHTATSGRIVRRNAETGIIEQLIDLQSKFSRFIDSGWCRGLLIDEFAYVGFSKMRKSSISRNLKFKMGSHVDVRDRSIDSMPLVLRINLDKFWKRRVKSVYSISKNELL